MLNKYTIEFGNSNMKWSEFITVKSNKTLKKISENSFKIGKTEIYLGGSIKSIKLQVVMVI